MLSAKELPRKEKYFPLFKKKKAEIKEVMRTLFHLLSFLSEEFNFNKSIKKKKKNNL